MSPEVARKTYAMLFENAFPELDEIYSSVGGSSGIALTAGAVGRITGSNSRITLAQQGLGTPPKVSNKVLNTSGYTGCNPLNIRAGGDKWQGAVGRTGKGYLIFSSPVDGIRAATKIIRNYSDKYGINTIEGIISRFAPASENPTNAYIQNVAERTGFRPDEKLDTKNPEVLQKLINAMIKQEIGGNPYSDETVNTGILKGLGKEDVKDYSDLYNTKLTDEEEAQYQEWAKKIGHERDVYDYDLRGAWKAGAAQAENGHFPDTFKKPNHHTFSNESKYHNETNRVGGHWVVENGQNIFIAPNGERRDDNGRLLNEATAKSEQSTSGKEAKLTAKDLVLNSNIKTGFNVIDNLSPQYRARLDQRHRQNIARQLQQQKIDLKKSVENGLSLATSQGDVSGVPDVAEFVSVYGQEEGLKLHKEVEAQARVNANMHEMPGMSLGEITNLSKSLTPQKDDPNYADHMEQKLAWDKAAKEVLKQRVSDPMAFAIQYVPAHELTVINDWNQPLPNTLMEVARRVSQFESLSESFGLEDQQRKLFTNDEALQLTETLGKMNAEQAAPLISALATVVNERGGAGATRALINQFSKDSKPTWLSSALALATSGNAVEKGYVKEYLAGHILLAEQQADSDLTKKALNLDIGGATNGLFGTREASRQASEIIKGIYAYRFTMGEDRKSVEDIVEDIFGRNEEFNGGRVFMPRTTDASMQFLMSNFVKSNANDKTSVRFRGGSTTLGELTKLLPTLRLESMDEGKYLVKDGTDYVRYGRNGAPLILDFNPIVTKTNDDWIKTMSAANDFYATASSTMEEDR